MTPEALKTLLEAKLAELPGDARVADARRAALAAFAEHGYPTRKHEAWRYTDLKPIAETEFELFPESPAPVDAAALMADACIEPGSAALVFLDGVLIADTASGRLGDGVELSSLAESLADHGPLLSAEDVRAQPLAALNVAFASQGARLRVAAGTTMDTPLHLLFVNRSAELQACQPQLAIEIAANAQAAIALRFVGAPECAGWVNALTRIELERGARLTLDRLQDYGAAQLHTELTEARLAADSSLSVTTIDIGGALVRNDLRVALAAPGASCTLTGLLLAAEHQHVDNHISVDHLAADTTSEQRFRSIVGAHGRAVFNGKVVVHKGTRAVSAKQSSDNLLLAESGEIDTKPELEIYADDVKCSHGATIGELDESQLFYLRTRGIAERTARGLLTLAFAKALLEDTAYRNLDDRIVGKFGLELPRDLHGGPSA